MPSVGMNLVNLFGAFQNAILYVVTQSLIVDCARHRWSPCALILCSSGRASCPSVLLWAHTLASPPLVPSLDGLAASLRRKHFEKLQFAKSRLSPVGTYDFLGALSFSSLYQWWAFPFFIFPILVAGVVSLSRVESRRRLWRGCRLQQRLGSSGSWRPTPILNLPPFHLPYTSITHPSCTPILNINTKLTSTSPTDYPTPLIQSLWFFSWRKQIFFETLPNFRCISFSLHKVVKRATSTFDIVVKEASCFPNLSTDAAVIFLLQKV